jgi:hypothetical protein
MPDTEPSPGTSVPTPPTQAPSVQPAATVPIAHPWQPAPIVTGEPVPPPIIPPTVPNIPTAKLPPEQQKERADAATE